MLKRFMPLFLAFTSSAFAQTNPITYNAVTDTNVHNSAAPSLGAAGTSTTDPDFSSSVMRVTASASCGADSGREFSPNEGAGWVRTINSNDTAVLFYGFKSGSVTWFVQPISVAGGALSLNGACKTSPLTGVNVGLSFSAVNPNLVYGIDPDGAHFDSWNWATNVTTQLVKVTAIPGFSLAASPSGALVLSYCDASDLWCAVSNGTQNNGTQVAFFNLSTGATQVLNFTNATYQTGSNAPIALNNLTSTQLQGCGVHEIYPGLDGIWWHFDLDPAIPHVGTQCGSLPNFAFAGGVSWQLGTNNITYIKDTNEAGGHETMGYAGVYINAPGASIGCGAPFVANAMTLWNVSNLGANPGNWVGVTNCSQIWTDNFSAQHFAWLNNFNDSFANSYPIGNVFTTSNTLTGDAYEWEFVMIGLSAANATLTASGPFGTWPSNANAPTVWRIAHTYNDPFNNQCSAQAFQSPNISQDGKFALFGSDWLGQTGTGTCTNSRRTDVFLVQMPAIATSMVAKPIIL